MRTKKQCRKRQSNGDGPIRHDVLFLLVIVGCLNERRIVTPLNALLGRTNSARFWCVQKWRNRWSLGQFAQKLSTHPCFEISMDFPERVGKSGFAGPGSTRHPLTGPTGIVPAHPGNDPFRENQFAPKALP